MKFRFITVAAATVAVAGMIAACGGTTTNTNNSRANVTNLGANNANTGAVVVNANTGTSNRWSNANVSRADYDKSRADYERDKGSSTIGSGANDSWLWFKTRAALLTTSDLRESTINVDVVSDVVTLKGSVGTAEQKTKAEQVAKGIEGVKSVKNELKVAPNDGMTNMSSNSNGKK